MRIHHALRAASGAGAGAGSGTIPTNGLITHYTMDSISGSTLLDETGNYDGTITGADYFGGGYLNFDGTTDRVDNSYPPKVQTWAWYINITADVIGDNDQIVDTIDGYGAAMLRFNTTNLLRFYVYGGTFLILETSVASSTNYRIVAQHNGTDTELWVNGVLEEHASNFGSVLYEGAESGRRIGVNYATQSGRAFNGKVFEFVEYDRMLTQTEITEHFS